MQDCTKLLFWLISAFISGVTRRSGRVPRIIVLGDERQAIYEFRGADARYLSNCPTIFADLSPDPWDRMTLTKSFRLSHQNTNFINKAFLYGENYIVGSHKGRKPLYIHTNPFRVHLLAKQLGPLIRKYGVENTAILGTSVRTNSTISKLTNYLTGKEQMPVAEPVSDDRGLDEVVIRGKICVSTIHQFKGSERDLVILYGLDDYYFQLAPQLPDDTCPNDVFVALSRAKKQIVVVHDAEKQMMPFVDISQLRKTAKHVFLVPETPSSFETRNPRMMTKVGLNLPNSVNASDIARHVQDEILTATVAKHVTVTTLSPRLASSEHINAPDKTPTDTKRHHFEAVSDINGVAVVAAYEFEFCGTLSALGKSKKDLAQITVPKEPRERAAWLCRESCRYLSELSTYQSRLLQMHEHRFDWLASYLTVACSRLQGQFRDVDPDSLKFEYPLNEPLSISDGVKDNLPQHQSTSIRGRADIIQKTKAGQGVTLWEIKFVSNLSREHVVQACVYAHLWAANHNGAMPNLILYNVRDGEKWIISPKDPAAGMRPLVEEVLRAKYTSRGKISDIEFLDECVKTREEVEGLFED
ncbi:DNA helicase IV [Microdochium nivale]|nr:DNA helicase IV [Microdochium nivale]